MAGCEPGSGQVPGESYLRDATGDGALDAFSIGR